MVQDCGPAGKLEDILKIKQHFISEFLFLWENALICALRVEEDLFVVSQELKLKIQEFVKLEGRRGEGCV